jgi:hypothetical protein
MLKRRHLFTSAFVLGTYALVVACGDDEVIAPATPDAGYDATTDTSIADVVSDRGVEQVGQSCQAPTDCYPQLDGQALNGEARCLDRVEGGYCTHTCQTDEDCCAVPGECKTGLKQVCAPFESTGEKYCFLSCEPADIASAEDAGYDAGAADTEYCVRQASPDFICRSTGGGAQNRKVCLPDGVPGDGGKPDADITDAADDGG